MDLFCMMHMNAQGSTSRGLKQENFEKIQKIYKMKKK